MGYRCSITDPGGAGQRNLRRLNRKGLVARAAGPVCRTSPTGCGWKFGRKNSVRFLEWEARGAESLICAVIGRFKLDIGIGCGTVSSASGGFISGRARPWLNGQCFAVGLVATFPSILRPYGWRLPC